MAGSVELKAVKKAIKKRRAYLLDNLSTLTMKQFRKLLEQDLALPDKALNEHKDFVSQAVDSIVKAQAPDAQPAAEPAAQQAAAQPERGEQPKKKARKQAEAAPAKPAADNVQANGVQHSKRFAKMKLVCKQAGVKVPPSVYMRKTPTQQEAALEDLLAKHQLAWDSTPQEIAAAQRRRAKEQDLEGIDASNIVEGGRRSRARVDYAAVTRTAYQGMSDATSEEEEEGGDDSASDASSDGGGSDAENVSPGNGAPRGRRQSGEAPDSEAEAAKRPVSATPGQSGGGASGPKPGKTPEAGKSPRAGEACEAGKSPSSGGKRQAGSGSGAAGGRQAKRRAVAHWSDDDEE